ncbi:MAG: M1 family aminopeptidase, partial [Actinomycetota bacterium]
VQLAIAIPLEGFVLGLSIGVWTAVFVSPEVPDRPTATAGRPDPWLLRALAGVAVLAFVANGVPTLIDDAWVRRQEDALAAIENREISPLEALRSPGLPSGSSTRTSYDVTAELTDEHLEWTTRIDYLNDTGKSLADIGINVYPAAYERRVPEIPLAPDLVLADLTGEFRAEARPAELDVARVAVNGTASVFARRGTALTIELPDTLPPGHRTQLTIDLAAELPHWPERFGVWRDTILLGNWIPVVAVRESGTWRLDRFGTIGDPFYARVADYSVEIEADALLGVVGSGVLTGVEEAGGDRRRWNFDAPAARDAAFALGRFVRGLQTVVDGTTLRSWYPATERERGADNLEAAASALGDYARRWGPPLYDEIDVVETEGMFGGMEYPGVVFVSAGTHALEGVPLLPHLITHAGFDDAQARYVVGHEIAHQWWYAAVGSDQIKQPWLDEALAEVAVRMWLRTTEGDDRTWRITNLIPSASPRDHVVSAAIDDYATNAAYTEDVYVSGAEVLMELRARVGGATFDAILAEWYERKTLETGTIEEFLDVVEEVGGGEAALFLSRYR